jgi:hypothetical protein
MRSPRSSEEELAWAYSALFLFLVLLSVELGVRGSAHDKAFD